MSQVPGAGVSASSLYRRIWRWHFFAGLFCLPFIFLLALTGAAYLFNKQIDDLVYADLLMRPPASVQATVPASTLVANAVGAANGVARALYLPVDAQHAVQVDVRQPDGALRQVFLDPANGRVLGSMDESDRIMGLVKRIHSLSVAGDAGNVLIEIVAGWVIVLVITGAYLWWPRGRSQGVLAIRPGASGRVWWRDLHAVTGAFGAVVILFLALTGMPWSIVWGKQVNGWVNAHGLGTPAAMRGGGARSQLPMAALGEVPWSAEQRPLPASSDEHAGHGEHAQHGQTATAQVPASTGIGVDRAVALFAASGLDGGYRLMLPQGPQGVYSAVRLRSAEDSQRVVHLDQYSGKVLQDLGPGDAGAVARVTDWGISVHQGIEYGWANQLLMLFGCLALMLSCVSGVVMWWKRRPAGQLAAPRRKEGERLAFGVLAIAIGLGLVFPLLGASMVVAALADFLWGRIRKPGAALQAS
ncbi:PepSY domain-containing protein [Massilia sp. 9I]|uniref:PepSY-associated TM helix domain-containing protein n=1 Tax=Massilia sp. 9I TaxID=2653152 RepID=UPI0012F3A74E|nr:PepSY domain-containing protein [Massilia sp. 9I]VXC14927.1 Uncharacterized iron-regulated membrane protein; Iron-uptake factor PiuB [Massilia sp. 9I]